MSLPANFIAGINSPDGIVQRWLEVAGLPVCWGTIDKLSGWFASRAAADGFTAIKPYFLADAPPANFDGELDPLEGVAKIMGQVEFNITDVGGALTASLIGNAKKDDWVYIAAEITATAASITYTGNGDGFGPTGTLYIGAETITYTGHNTVTKTFTGCARGRYRSAAKAWGVGFPVSPRSYTLKGRRVWYYQTAHPRCGPVATDGDKVLRFAGTIEGLRDHNVNKAAYVLRVLSLESSLNRNVFRDLRSVYDDRATGISGPKYTADEPGIRSGNCPGFTTDTFYTADASKFDNGEISLFKVDDEFIFFQQGYSAGPQGMRMLQRAKFGSVAEAHKPGFVMKECAWLTQKGNDFINESAQCPFSSVPTTTSPLPADHTLIVLLQFILSTGAGTNTPGGGARNYDVLSEGGGLGIEYSRVDIAGIEALAAEFPELRNGGIWFEPTNFIDIVKEFLSPFGFYALSTIGDVWTIRYLRPPLPDEVGAVIDNSVRINGSRPSWDGNLAEQTQEVIFNYDYDTKRGMFMRVVVETFSDSKLYSCGEGKSLTYDLKHVYPVSGNIIGRPAIGGMVNIDLVLKKRADFYKSRYVRPPPIITERVRYCMLGLEVGDIVAVTATNIPNNSTAARGLTGVLCQVIKKSVDERSKTIELTLLGTGYGLGDYRFFSPSLEVASWENTTHFTYLANSFTEALKNGLSQDDGQLRSSTGAIVHPFVVNQHVKLVGPDFNNIDHVQIAAINYATRQVGLAVAPAAFNVGAFITLDDYDTDDTLAAGGEDAKMLYAWLADASLFIGVDNEPAHRYSS